MPSNIGIGGYTLIITDSGLAMSFLFSTEIFTFIHFSNIHQEVNIIKNPMWMVLLQFENHFHVCPHLKLTAAI